MTELDRLDPCGPDPELEVLAELVHFVRLEHNADLERPLDLNLWPDRTEGERDLDRRVALALRARVRADLEAS